MFKFAASLLCALTSFSLLSACQLPLSPLFNASPPAGRNYSLKPEYEPVQGMIISEHLAAFPNGQAFLSSLLKENAQVWLLSANQDLLQQTRANLTSRFGIQADSLSQLKSIPIATESVWARDWAPLFSFSSSNPQQIGLVDYRYYPDRPLDDAVPSALADYLRQSGLQAQALPIDVELEGGNVLCTAQNCFVSEEVLRRVETRTGQNADAAAIKAKLESYITQNFTIVPRLPFESTGHIDIWAKLLNAKTLIIGQISEESLAAVPEGQQETYRQVMEFLDEQASGLTKDGVELPTSLAAQIKQLEPEIRIVRIPMPTPGVFRGVETFRTYTNSVLYNGLAIVPQYGRGTRSRFQNRELATEYEQAVAKIYEQAGYKVLTIPADNLIRDGGAWHCVVMQIPELPGGLS